MKNKTVLYITNIAVPYRVIFFNQLACYCDLTVLYERYKSGDRNSEWANSIDHKYEHYFLGGIHIGNESSFDFNIFKYILNKKYDVIILGCYSSPIQIFANFILRAVKKKFIINFDGEVYLSDKSLKTIIKKIVLQGADSYLIAGNKAALNLKKIVRDKKIVPYYFSSLIKSEVLVNGESANGKREDFVLVVGQYFDYKGLDIAAKMAILIPDQKFKFIGMGYRTQKFIDDNSLDNYHNITVVPFLKKSELFIEFKKCKCFLLPSRRECWGLVINEVASFGTPIISTYGCGAAVEYISEKFPEYLAKPNDVNSLLKAFELFNTDKRKEEFSYFLINKSKDYYIEKNVSCHLELINEY